MLFPGGHAASICENTPEAICRELKEEEEEEEEEEVLHFLFFPILARSSLGYRP
jgi:hypothetical protein